MKMKGSKEAHYDAGPNMTPLVDVVMVILIFMMLAGSFGAQEHYLVSNLPVQQQGAGGTPPSGQVDEPLEVRVDSIPGGFRAVVGGKQVTTSETLVHVMQTMHDQFEAVKPGSSDKTQVIISPGKSVKYTYLIGAYEAALQAGFKKVAFATAH